LERLPLAGRRVSTAQVQKIILWGGYRARASRSCSLASGRGGPRYCGGGGQQGGLKKRLSSPIALCTGTGARNAPVVRCKCRWFGFAGLRSTGKFLTGNIGSLLLFASSSHLDPKKRLALLADLDLNMIYYITLFLFRLWTGDSVLLGWSVGS
jgi:hypothetical protein